MNKYPLKYINTFYWCDRAQIEGYNERGGTGSRWKFLLYSWLYLVTFVPTMIAVALTCIAPFAVLVALILWLES